MYIGVNYLSLEPLSRLLEAKIAQRIATLGHDYYLLFYLYVNDTIFNGIIICYGFSVLIEGNYKNYFIDLNNLQ